MPGTILVSVLDFMGLPLSSTSIKVSMGKVEYIINEKGDFSFPLTSLREDCTIKLQDADGNEISRIGLHTKTIVEKGVWEDNFALGHGHLHLKLQFILNDEDRDRIRMMRESALKKKHGELLRSSSKGSESSSAAVGNAALTFRNDEVSESPKKYLQLEAVSRGKHHVGFRTEKNSGPDIVLGAEPDIMQSHPNITEVQYKEYSSDKPMSEAFGLTKLQEKILSKKPAFDSPFSKDPQRAIVNSEEIVATSFRSSNQNEVAENNNNRILPNPSSVRKMISAFEEQTGLVQDMRSPIKSPPTEHHSSTVETKAKASSKAQFSDKDKAWNKEPVRVARVLKQARLYNGEIDGRLNSLSNRKELLNKQTDSNSRNKFKLSQKTYIDKEKNSKGFARTFAFEAVTDSEMCEKILNGYHHRNLFDSRQDSGRNPNTELDDFDDDFCPFECSGAWIFPDEPRKFCLTAGGKNVMALVESLDTKCINRETSLNSLMLENMDKDAAHIVTGAEATKQGEIDETEESKSKNYGGNGDESTRRPVKKVIKAALIIGFGIFVVLTRQRRGR